MSLMKCKGRMVILWFFSHSLDDSLPDRQSLSSKLTIELSYSTLIWLKVSSTSPNSPIVDITTSFYPIIANSINWWWRNVRNIRTFILYNFRYKNLEKFMIILFIFTITPTPILNSLQNLIISWPKSQSWIIPSPSYLLFYLFLNIQQKLLTSWIYTVTKHEIIKKHYPFSWSQL